MNIAIISLYIVQSVSRYTIIGLIIVYFGLDISSIYSIEPRQRSDTDTEEDMRHEPEGERERSLAPGGPGEDAVTP